MYLFKTSSLFACYCRVEHSTMGCYRIQLVAIFSFMLLLPNTQGWGEEGHVIVCKIAQVHSLLLPFFYLSLCLICLIRQVCHNFFSIFLNRLASATQLHRLWKSYCQNQQKMTWQPSVHGQIMSEKCFLGHLLCTLPILLTPFAVTRMTVSSFLILLPIAPSTLDHYFKPLFGSAFGGPGRAVGTQKLQVGASKWTRGRGGCIAVPNTR